MPAVSAKQKADFCSTKLGKDLHYVVGLLMYLISEETLKSTTKCQFDFACLEGNGFPKCVVDYSVKNNGVFIKQENDQRCPYKMAFGYSYICYCPTRYEIYEKYER
jgi:hypothetical protein